MITNIKYLNASLFSFCIHASIFLYLYGTFDRNATQSIFISAPLRVELKFESEIPILKQKINKQIQSATSNKNKIIETSFLERKDQIKSVENFKTIKLKKIAYPVIFLSFLSRASEIIGKKIHIRLDQNEILLNLNVNICSSFLNQEIPKFANEIEIKFIDNEDSFTESEWNSLYKLAEDTFVEESDSLKEGAAGAGLTDND